MKQININAKHYSVVINYNDPKNIVLLTGAIVAPMSASLDAMNQALRNTNTTTDASGNIITTADIVFKSTSACASFIVGSPQSGNRFFAKYLQNASNTSSATNTNTTQTDTSASSVGASGVLTDAEKDNLAKEIKIFCKDFEFNPDPRCLNNMLYVKDINDYVLSFMQVIGYDESLIDLAKSKMKSAEWKNLIKGFKKINPSHPQFNDRLVVLYGSAGTGKTTYATNTYGIFDNTKIDDKGKPLCVNMVVASASEDPSELFTRFDPVSRKYVLTAIGEAMQNGTPVIIDEANFYNTECHKRLQGITDTKKAIIDNGILITIKDGFKMIMTMNLETNTDGKRPLPNPLASRAKEIVNYDNTEHAHFEWVW